MNKKVSLLIISLVLTVIVFTITTHLQKKLVDYVPTIKCMIASRNIESYEKAEEEAFEYVDMPIAIVASTKIVQSYEEIEDLYVKDKLYKGQILIQNQFDSKENLNIYQAEQGKEKIAIKVKNSENGVSYTIKENSIVNVYATMQASYAQTLPYENITMVGTNEDGYCVIKVLDSVKILGTFNSNGDNTEDIGEKNIDTILVAVPEEKAKQINLIREFANFNITEVGTMATAISN